MTFTLSEEKEKTVDRLLARYPTKQAACIPLLHLCQREKGWVDGTVVDYVAQRLELSTAHVKGVVTFYTMFHQHEVAPNVISVCRTLSCDLRGAKTIQEHLEKRLGCRMGHTSPDGKVTLKKAECLAGCGNAPMIQLNDELHEHLTIEALDRLLDQLEIPPLPPEPKPAPVVARPVPSPVAASEEGDDDEGDDDEGDDEGEDDEGDDDEGDEGDDDEGDDDGEEE